MTDIWIFGGTTEGRLLAEYCVKHKRKALVSVVSDYGRQMLPKSEYLTLWKQAMDESDIVEYIKKEQVKLVIDATHPYAEAVSRNIKAACGQCRITCVRVVRRQEQETEREGDIIRVNTTEEAVEYLKQTTGPVLVTTGSKELELFTQIPDYETRIFARVLPDSQVIDSCRRMGWKGRQLIAMQGPFDRELNMAMIRQLGIRYLVTKEAGKAGGFLEKIEAAQECNIVSVVIGRPAQEEGISLEEACALIMPKTVYLIGMGMGSVELMTVAAVQALKQCQAVLGAPRLLECAAQVVQGCETAPVYESKAVAEWLTAHPEYSRIGIVMSGDTGFYSGTKKILEVLKQEPLAETYQVMVLPGISSVSYLCARIGTTWEDVYLASIHGRECDIIKLLKEHERVFCLTEGGKSILDLCDRLNKCGYSDVRITAGEALSYPDERIIKGTPGQIAQEKFGSLTAVLIEKTEKTADQLVEEYVHNLYWTEDVNCAGTMLTCLGKLFHYEVGKQTLRAAIGMHGAGGYRAQCGLVEGGLMFMGSFFGDMGKSDSEIADLCFRFADEFTRCFGSLSCYDLRPGGFTAQDPPHMCEALTRKAVLFAWQFIKTECEVKA